MKFLRCFIFLADQLAVAMDDDEDAEFEEIDAMGENEEYEDDGEGDDIEGK